MAGVYTCPFNWILAVLGVQGLLQLLLALDKLGVLEARHGHTRCLGLLKTELGGAHLRTVDCKIIWRVFRNFRLVQILTSFLILFGSIFHSWSLGLLHLFILFKETKKALVLVLVLSDLLL